LSETLRAEWTKARTVSGTLWLLCGIIAATTAVGSLVTVSTRCGSDNCIQDPAKISLTGIYLGQAVVAVLAVLAISDEYSTGMIRVSLTAMPRRAGVLAAKAAVLAGLVFTAGAMAVLGSVLAGWLWLPGSGYNGSVSRAAFGSVLYLVLVGLLSLGVAAMVRDSAVAIGVVLSLLFVFPVVAHFIGNSTWQWHLEQVGPMTAGMAIQNTVNLGGQPIGPWAGLGVLAAWAAGAMLTGGLLLVRRDA